MFSLLKLSTRNIWRNKRRTFITVGSILFAVFFASLMNSIQKGTWDNMVNSVIKYYFGYAQIHQKGYWEDQSMDKSMAINEELLSLSDKVENVTDLIPRLEGFALGSVNKKTKGVLVIGTDPDKENKLTELEGKLVEGNYFAAGDKSVLVAQGLAEYLGLEVGDTLIMIGQGYHGVNAAGKYPVDGLVKFGSPELNKRMVYLPLAEAQWFFGAENRLTSLVINTDKPKDIRTTISAIKSNLGSETYEIMDWEELIPDLVQARALDEAGGVFILNILYVIIGFGIFGTLLMMLKEREYEFGVLLSIGMKKGQIFIMLWIEILILALIGVLAGILVATPLLYYFSNNPIKLEGDMAAAYDKFGIEPLMAASFDPSIFVKQGMIILLMVSVLSLYPFFKIRKLDPIKAMRH